MKPGVRGKLFLISLALMLFVGGLAAWVLNVQLRHTLTNQIEAHLRQLVATTALAVSGARLSPTVENIDPLADALGQAANVRVTILSNEGVVLGDSEVPTQDIPAVENHRNRPEVKDALSTGLGESERFSATVHHNFLYMAAPWSDGPNNGLVRVALPLESVDTALRVQRRLILVAALVGLIVAIVMSGVASHWMTKPLRELMSAISLGPEGAQPRKANVTSKDELGRIAGSFNTLVEELQSLIAEKSLERERLASLLESMGEGVIAIDERNRITLANSAVVELLKLDGSPVGRLLPEVVRAAGVQKLLNRSGESRREYEFTLTTVPPKKILARAADLRSRPGMVLVFHDVTELRRLEEVRLDFVANLSHELRTPLGVIKANAETLLDGALSDEGHARIFVEAIDRQANRLDDLVRDVMDLVRSEHPNAALETERVFVGDAVEIVMEQIAPLAKAKNIEVQTRMEDGLWIAGHARGLEHAVFNLADNAVKYTPAGGHVQISAIRKNGWVRIEVEDDGPGIEPQHHERIFERFYRVDKGRSRETGGTGLGLSVVKNAVQSMKGRSGVALVQPHGSLFWIELPASQAGEAQEAVDGPTEQG